MALSFGAFEFFWLALFGVMMSGAVAGTDAVKGWLMGFVGLFAALIGQDGMHAYDRFTFGIPDLGGGLSLIPTLVGAFGFSEILTVISRRAEKRHPQRRRLGAAAHQRRAEATGGRSFGPA